MGSMTEEHRKAISEAVLGRNQWIRETAHLREAVEAGNERLAVFLIQEIIRSREVATPEPRSRRVRKRVAA